MDYKRLPYVIADFTWIQNQNRFLTDKTMFIPKMEEAGDFLYLIRPRRCLLYTSPSPRDLH